MHADSSVPAEESSRSNQDAGAAAGDSTRHSNPMTHAASDQSSTTQSTSSNTDQRTTSTSPTTTQTSTSPLGVTETVADTTTQEPTLTGTTGESGGSSATNSNETPTSSSEDDSSEAVGEIPAGVPAIVGVGYGGLRIVSRDNGLSWGDQAHWKGPYSEGEDKDDTYLLRSIAYGNGIWVAAGWQLTTSTDGVNWSEPQNTRDVLGQNDCGITDGMAFGNGHFLAACGSSLNRSIDGGTWEKVSDLPNVGGHPYVVYDADSELFALTGDNGASFTSGDGSTWTSIDEDRVALCARGFTSRQDCPGFYHDGVLLDSGWPGSILRSTDGSDWEEVYEDPFDISVYTAYAFAAGYVSP